MAFVVHSADTVEILFVSQISFSGSFILALFLAHLNYCFIIIIHILVIMHA